MQAITHAPARPRRKVTPKPPPSRRWAWRIYVLGHAVFYEPARRRMTYMGPRSGAAWVLVCRLRNRLQAHVSVDDHPTFAAPHDAHFMAVCPGLDRVWL